MPKRGDANLDLAFLEQPLQATPGPQAIGTGLPGHWVRPVAMITPSPVEAEHVVGPAADG